MSVANSSSLIVRKHNAVAIWKGIPFTNTKLKFPCTSAKFSEDGSKLMVIKSEALITIYYGQNLERFKSFEITNLVNASLSPRGTYLQTLQKATSPQEEKIVTLWNTQTRKPVHTVSQENMTTLPTRPTIQFSSDEAVMSQMAKDKVELFDTSDSIKAAANSIEIRGVASAELSKKGDYVAVFVPESKGSLANVQIYACAADSKGVLVARSLLGCSSVKMLWNNESTGLLIVVQADAEKSFYEHRKLHLLTVNGCHNLYVPLRKEGPLHDVQWSCSGDSFGVVYGSMPAMVTIFDKKCKPLLELETGPYNTIRWNPNGGFMLVAGYGNLPFCMAFWDYVDKKHLHSAEHRWTVKSECSKPEWIVSSEWSPDGRYFLTTTTARSLQVANRIKIYGCDGNLCFEKKVKKLYQVDWIADSPDKLGEIEDLVKSAGSLEVDSKPQGQKPKSSQAPPVKPIKTPVQAASKSPNAKAAATKKAQLSEGTTQLPLSKTAQRKRTRKENKKKAEADSAANDAH